MPGQLPKNTAENTSDFFHNPLNWDCSIWACFVVRLAYLYRVIKVQAG